MLDGITLRDVFAARARLTGITRETPLEPSPWLSEVTGAPVHLKLECWQRTNSFKLRGAYNAVASLGPLAAARGIVAASAGNHGQGVALAATELGAASTVFVPTTAPETKKQRIRRYGATLREAEGGYDGAEGAARAFAEETGACFVHPYLDPTVVAGQGTIGLEVLERQPALTDILVPIGGGGLIAGIGLVVKQLTDGCARVHGVQSEHTNAMRAALETGRLDPPPARPTLADGLAGGVDAEAVERVRIVADGVVVVPELGVGDAIAQLFRHHGIVVEGSAAVGIAALLHGLVRPTGPTVVVLTGANIDAARLAPLLGT